MSSTTYRRPILWKCSGLTDVGVVRKLNEDAIISRPDVGIWAVADGMGGHEAGEVASAKVVEALAGIKDCARLSELVDSTEDALLNVNEQMLQYARQKFGDATIGSTVVVLIIRGKVGVCLWVGDSRLYRLRNNNLQRVSRDHSQVEEMLHMGLLTPEEAVNYPQSNVITRAVGVEPQLYVDIEVFDTQIGDIYLLCSDGLYNTIVPDDIVASLSVRDVEQSSEQLIQKTLANGAKDNVSVVVVQGEPGKLPR